MGEGEAERVAGELEKLLPGRVSRDPAILRIYAREASGVEGAPWAVVFPESPGDVSRLLAHAYRREYPVYPQGSATSLAGSAAPLEGGVVLSLERMRSIKSVSVEDYTVDVEPGVRLAEVNLALSTTPLFFPIDPGSVKVATVGGAIASGAGGMMGARYGTMRDWVLGLTVVLPDEKGSIVRLGCRTLKCRQGLDLVRLIVGSEGTLAVVIEATLRLAPRPEATPTMLAFFPSEEAALEAALDVRRRGMDALLLEYMDVETARLAAEARKAPVKVEGYMLLASIASTRESRGRHLAELEEIARSRGAESIYRAASLEAAEEKGLLEVRRGLFAGQILAGRRRFPGRRIHVLIEDIAVPPSKLSLAASMIRAAAAEAGLPVGIGGHVGDGNLHPSIAFPLDDPSAAEAAWRLHEEIGRIALRLGGTVSAEHGIGVEKKGLLERELEHLGAAEALRLMRGIKRVFDPKGILNPGKVIPP